MNLPTLNHSDLRFYNNSIYTIHVAAAKLTIIYTHLHSLSTKHYSPVSWGNDPKSSSVSSSIGALQHSSFSLDILLSSLSSSNGELCTFSNSLSKELSWASISSLANELLKPSKSFSTVPCSNLEATYQDRVSGLKNSRLCSLYVLILHSFWQ